MVNRHIDVNSKKINNLRSMLWKFTDRISSNLFLVTLFFLLLCTKSFGQATVTIEINWPSYANENRYTLYNPSNVQLGQVCFPARCFSNGGPNQSGNSYFLSTNYNVPYASGYSVLLEDTGDGWQGSGAYLRVYVDGILVVDEPGNDFSTSKLVYFDVSTAYVSIDDVTASEESGTITFTATSLGTVSGGFSIDYATADGSALVDSDYTSTSGTLNFAGTNGESLTISVPLIDNSYGESSENFFVNLSNPSGTAGVADGTGEGIITDTDPPIPNDVPLTLFEEFRGYYDYTSTGGSLRTESNDNNFCAITSVSSDTLLSSIPAGATIERAYLYWAHSNTTPDELVTFEGQTVSADYIYGSVLNTSGILRQFYGYLSDITDLVNAIPDPSSNVYDFTDLNIINTGGYCDTATVLGGWNMIVFYQEPSLPAVTINLYQGFNGLSNSGTSFTLDSFFAIGGSGSKASFLSWEGDANLDGSSAGSTNPEELSILGDGDITPNILSGDGGQTGNNAYNSTIYDNTLSPVANNSTSYGLDWDTFDISGFIDPSDTQVTANVDVGQDFVISNAVVLKVPSNLITGTVFEDQNYGGGVGRNLVTSNGVAVSGATVELYDATNTLISTKTTNAIGKYVFAGMSDGNYIVRVVNATVTSTRTGGDACTDCFAIQTFRSYFDGTNLIDVTNEIGGANPSQEDTAAGILTGAQTVSAVTIGGNGVVGLDFGFNFDTVVNVNSIGQGSLNQFIRNSNALGDEISLVQEGLTAGRETSIFEIPGTGPHIISLSHYLPIVSGESTWLDATTQDGASCEPRDLKIILDGNNTIGTGIRLNNLQQGIQGFSIRGFTSRGIYIQSGALGAQILCNHVGVDPTGMSITPNDSEGIDINAVGVHIGNGTAFGRNIISGNGYDGISLADFTGDSGLPIKIIGNYIGVAGDGLTPFPNGTTGGPTFNGAGIEVIRTPNAYLEIGGLNPGDGNVISGNLESGVVIEQNSSFVTIFGNKIGVSDDGIVPIGNTSNGLHIISASEITIGNGTPEGRNIISANGVNGLSITSTTAIQVYDNYIGVGADGTTLLGNLEQGINIGGSSNIVIGGSLASLRNIIAGNLNNGIKFSSSSTGMVSKNQIYNNSFDGIAVEPFATNVTITENQIYNNGRLGIDLGTDDITLNDMGDSDTGPNEFINFPLFQSVTTNGVNLTLKGLARPGTIIELFVSDITEGTAALGDNQFGFSKDYGEGQTYITTLIEGSASDLDTGTGSYADADGNTDNTNRFEFTIPLPSGLVLGNLLTATGTVGNNTSEFSPLISVNANSVITNRRITFRVKKN